MATRSKASSLASIFLIIVNFITVILSLSAFGIGLWVIISPKTLATVLQERPTLKLLFPEDSLGITFGVTVTMLSIFFLFISTMGLYGAINCSQFLLFMYATLILLLMLLECAVFFYFTSNIAEKGVPDNDGEFEHVLRLALKCCDHSQNSTEKSVPWSCCGTRNCSRDTIFEPSCKSAMTTWLRHYGTIVYSSIIASHVVLSSCSLLRRASSASRSRT